MRGATPDTAQAGPASAHWYVPVRIAEIEHGEISGLMSRACAPVVVMQSLALLAVRHLLPNQTVMA
jgi:hypothetical protein